MKRLFLPCLAFVFLALGAGARAESLALSVLTYNIRYDNPGDGEDRWEKRRDEAARLIKDHDPDVVGLQEALRNQLDDLAKALPAYSEIGVGRDDGKTKGEYSAILYRTERFKLADNGTFWFSDTPQVPGSKTWGNGITRICTWAKLVDKASGRAVSIFNVHLDHQSQPSREKSAELLAARAHAAEKDGSVIITGDFNAGESNPAILTMKAGEHGFVDSFRIAHPDEKEAGTFNDFGRGKGSKEKIDYIWVQKSAKVESAGIDRRSKEGHFPSDHHAVWAKLILPEMTKP